MSKFVFFVKRKVFVKRKTMSTFCVKGIRENKIDFGQKNILFSHGTRGIFRKIRKNGSQVPKNKMSRDTLRF